MNVMELAAGRWEGILAQFLEDSFLTRKNGPCPLCGGKDRYRYLGGDRGRWVCNQCAPETEDGMELLIRYTGESFREMALQVEKMAGQVRMVKTNKPDPKIAIRRVWQQTAPVSEVGPVVRYLKARGLESSPVLREGKVPYYHDGEKIGEYMAMVAPIMRNGKLESLHITYLNGPRKADLPSPRKILTPVNTIKGAAVPLAGFVDGVIGIAEGVETAIAARMQFGIPTVACINANNLPEYMPEPGVRDVVVFGDNDASHTGQKYAHEAAWVLKRNGYDVTVEIPAQQGDWNDEWIRTHKSGGTSVSSST